jgi:hypothetical protein
MDRGNQCVGRTKGKGCGRPVAVGGRKYDEPWRSEIVACRGIGKQVAQRSLVYVGEGDENRVGLGARARVRPLYQLEPGPG